MSAKKRAPKKSSQSAIRAKRVSGQTSNVNPASTTLLTPEFMDQIVPKVADVVTQRLTGAPPSVTNLTDQPVTQSQPLPSTSNPAPAVETQVIDSLVEEAVVS